MSVAAGAGDEGGVCARHLIVDSGVAEDAEPVLGISRVDNIPVIGDDSTYSTGNTWSNRAPRGTIPFCYSIYGYSAC